MDGDPKPLAGVVMDSYARLSRNPDGLLEKIDRQLEDNRRTIERLGATVGVEHIDNSLSAWKRGVKRKGWDAALARMQDGRSGGVVVWHVDRMMRQPRDLEVLIDLAEEKGIRVANSWGLVDLCHELINIRVSVAHAEQSSRDTSRRLKKMFDGRRKAGHMSFCGPRTFGWPGMTQKDSEGNQRVVEASVVKAERAALKWAYKAVLTGTPLGGPKGVAAEWNKRGLRTYFGNEWDGGTVRPALRRPRHVGLVTHEGKVVSVATNVKPVVDIKEFNEVGALLDARKTGRPLGQRLLASGLISCGKCGKKLVSRPQYAKGVAIPTYTCVKSKHDGCGGTRIHAHFVDDALQAFVVERLSDPTVAGAISASLAQTNERIGELEKRIATAERSRNMVSAQLGREETTPEAYEEFMAGMIPRLKAMRVEHEQLVAEAGDSAAVEAQSRAEIEAQWAAGDVMDKRRLIERSMRGFRCVIVAPVRLAGAQPGDRVTFVPAGQPLAAQG